MLGGLSVGEIHCNLWILSEGFVLVPPQLPAKHIAQAFDGEAGQYAEAFEKPLVAAEMRQMTHRLYAQHLAADQRILDLNCGPGSDFAFFNQLGVELHGLDISPEMLRLAGTRSSDAVLHCLDYNDLDQLPGRFHGICSNFGGLNTQPDFEGFAEKCHKKLVPKGFLYINIMTPLPLTEIAEGILTRRHWMRRLRHKPSNPVKVGAHLLPVYYFWPGAFYRKFFKQHFSCLRIQGLGVFFPPPYVKLERQTLPSWRVFLEGRLSHRWPFRAWGDHAMIVMQAR